VSPRAPRRGTNGKHAPVDGQRFLAELDSRRAAVAEQVRTVLGTGADAAPAAAAPFRPSGLLVRLSLLAAVAAAPVALFTALQPEMSDVLATSRSALGGFGLLQQIVVALAALGVAVLVHRRGRSARVVLVTAAAGAVATAALGVAATGGAVILGLMALGLAVAAARALHPALLVDGHPPAVRTRVLATHRAADGAGRVLALSAAAVLAGSGLTWRAAFLIAGALSVLVVAVVAARHLRAPNGGEHDTEAVRALVADAQTSEGGDQEAPPRQLREELRRVLHLATVRRVLGVWAALGALVLPLLGFVGYFLAQRWHVTTTGRLGVLAVATAFTLPVLALVAPRADAAFAADPGAPLRFAAGTCVVAAAALAIAAASPWFPVAVIAIGVVLATTAAVVPLLDVAALSVVPSAARPLVAALAQAAFLAVGGLGGVLVFGGVDRRFGLAGGVASLVLPALLAAWLARRSAASVAGDLQRLGDEVVVTEELRRHVGAGHQLPLLVCRGIDFSYGPLQVLFGVDFTVEEGQLVALLGTNGAGKSTLLRVVSGLGIPSAGSVHLRGEDITFTEPDRRVARGVAQVPGGRAVFGPLTVAENLRVVGAAAGRDKRSTDAAIDTVFDAFPRLAERRGQLASTLSGGEQQMLGLSKALLLRPPLLLVDELSLGLAPKVVGELLALVRRINAEGTAVVLVEQSVNVALSLADHAYFMEKGEVRFDGPASKLLDRGDLIRSVFLGGAAARLAGTGGRG
jgi:ABC-type branched-subunit amino acid transport system ATPase component